MIVLVNYGLGNIQAIANIYRRLNIPVNLASSAEELRSAEKVILPGVGAFDWAMTRLNESGMRGCLDDLVSSGKCIILGICVGMQMMARRSEEGKLPGLGWIDAEVRRFDDCALVEQTHLPHMGWNDVRPSRTDGLFRGLETAARFYFLHSYFFAPQRSDDVLAVTDYGGTFASAIRSANVLGVQFHPEKSHQWGIQLLRNFAEL
jgi:glutamine amidotransferase